MKPIPRNRLSLAIVSALGLPGLAHAADPLVINDKLTGASSSYDWKALNGACLTAGASGAGGSIPPCSGLAYYGSATQVGGATGRLPDAVGQGALRLTNGDTKDGGSNGDNQTGAVVSNFTFPTNQGLSVTWTSVTYGGDNLNSTGADGISFFLSDGAYDPSVGALGGSLGYSCSNLNGTYDGVVGAYLGIGIDEYGNFSNKADNTDTGDKNSGLHPKRISLRGAGSTAASWLKASPTYSKYYPSSLSGSDLSDAIHNTCKSGYAWNYSGSDKTDSTNKKISTKNQTGDKLAFNYPLIKTSDLPASVSIANQEATNKPLRSQAIPITYALQITSDGLLDFNYSVNGGSTINVLSGQKVTDSNGPLPSSFRFGFSSGTGGGNNVHEITCFKAAPANQSNTSAGSNVQQSARVNTGSQVYLAYFHPTNWWGQLTSQTIYYDTTANQLLAGAVNWDASCVLTGGTCAATGKTVAVQGPGARTILSWDGTKGIPFQAANISSAQATALNVTSSSDRRLQFLRGDRSNEVANSGTYRNRSSVLGDIVDSSPTWAGAPSAPYTSAFVDRLSAKSGAEGSTYATFAKNNATRQNVVYVGANDGLMHGFRSGAYSAAGSFDGSTNDGTELLAYMPGQVVSTIHPVPSNNKIDYSNTQYSHNFFVDATPGTGDLYYQGAWHTWLVAGLGRGGQMAADGPVNDPTASATGAVFALDITDPSTFSEANASSVVLGEWTSSTIASCAGVTGTCGAYLGEVWGRPIIRRLHDGNWAVIFGNGMNSANGTAGLFIMHVDATTGATSMQYIDTGYGTAQDPQGGGARNGIVEVTSADLDGDHVTDYVYAGDFFGNVWRFDLTSGKSSDWSVRSTPVFSTPAGQPITTAVTVTGVPNPVNGATKVMVTFGTGEKLPQTLTKPETYASGTQYVYGVWDWDMGGWNRLSADSRYESRTSGAPTASNLQTQTVKSTLAGSGDVLGYRVLSNNAVCWIGTSACVTTNDQYGWKLALPTSTEQIVYNPYFSSDLFIINTTIPASSQILSCTDSPASGYTMALNIGTGGASAQSVFRGPTGNFTDSNISGIGVSGTGTVSVMIGGQQQYIVQQTLGGTGTGGTVNIKEINVSGGKGQRLNWTQVR